MGGLEVHHLHPRARGLLRPRKRHLGPASPQEPQGGEGRGSARKNIETRTRSLCCARAATGRRLPMQNEDQPKRGRPSAYNDRIAEAICDRLVDRESLRAICADPGMPAKATVFRWLATNKEFRQSYAFARACQAEDLAFEILKIADDSSRDYVKKTGVDGKVTWVFDKEHFARQPLKINALKWIMAGWRPESTATAKPGVRRRDPHGLGKPGR